MKIRQKILAWIMASISVGRSCFKGNGNRGHGERPVFIDKWTSGNLVNWTVVFKHKLYYANPKLE